MKIAFTFLSALFLSLFSLAHAEEAAKSRTIVIFDASGSMWGEIDGKPKIEIAKATGRDLIKNRPDNLEMGFMAYGHRKKGDCDDIELLVAPGAETTENLLGAVEKLVPKGKTPIYKSVLQAAETLKFSEEAGSVILVSDGIETCGGDLDALGKKLAEQGINFKTHIIGFAMKEADTVDLKKLAETTGGTYADAGDAAELKSALENAVASAVTPKNQLTLIPIAEDGKAVLKTGVKFEIYKDKSAETPMQTATGGKVTIELEPQKYIVTAEFSGRTLEAMLDVKAGETTTHNFVFSTPALSLSAILKKGDEPIGKGIHWKILGASDSEGNQKLIDQSYKPTPEFRLPAGDYMINVSYKDLKAEKPISFGEEPQAIQFVLGGGTLKLSASSIEGAEPFTKGMNWGIFGPANSEGKRERITQSYKGTAEFTMPAGRYLVQIKRARLTIEEEIEVVGGEVTEKNFVLGSGTLQASAVMSEGAEVLTTKGLAWKVFAKGDAEGNLNRVDLSYSASPTFTLLAGTYRITVTRGNATAEADVTVTSGKKTTAQLNLNAAVVKPAAIMVEGGEKFTRKGLTWEVLGQPNAEGNAKRVTVSYNAEPTFFLPVGEYALKLSRGSAIAEELIKVESGKLNSVSVNLNCGILQLNLSDASGKAVKPKSWSVLGPKDAEGNRKKFSTSSDKTPKFSLPAGDFLIKANTANKEFSKEITVTAGKLNEVMLTAE